MRDRGALLLQVLRQFDPGLAVGPGVLGFQVDGCGDDGHALESCPLVGSDAFTLRSRLEQ